MEPSGEFAKQILIPLFKPDTTKFPTITVETASFLFYKQHFACCTTKSMYKKMLLFQSALHCMCCYSHLYFAITTLRYFTNCRAHASSTFQEYIPLCAYRLFLVFFHSHNIGCSNVRHLLRVKDDFLSQAMRVSPNMSP